MAFVDVMLKETDGAGLNQGLLELASSFEVADDVHHLMRDTFPASGRVSFHLLWALAGERGGEPM